MINRSLVPRSWRQVRLTVAPGLTILLGSLSSAWASLRFLMLAVFLLLIISSIVLAIKRRSLFQVPVWGFIPFGWLAGFASLWTFSSLGFYPTCFLLVVTGLVFARHNGLSASLFVLTGGILTASYAVEPSMYLADSLFRRIFLDIGMIALFWILSPIWILRSRSILGQAMGMLFPMAAYSAALVFALSSGSGLAQPWFQFSFSRSVSIAGPFIGLFAITAIAAAVYAWISSRDFTAGKAQPQSAT